MRRGLMLVLLVSRRRVRPRPLKLLPAAPTRQGGRLTGLPSRRGLRPRPLERLVIMPTVRRAWWIPSRSLPRLLWGLLVRLLALPGLLLVARRRLLCRLVRLRIVPVWPRSRLVPLSPRPRRLLVVLMRPGRLLVVRSLALLGLLRASPLLGLLLRLRGVVRRRLALMPTAPKVWWIPCRGMMTVSLWRGRPALACAARRATGARRARLALPRGTRSAGSPRRTHRRPIRT